jgi:hypothetical protein
LQTVMLEPSLVVRASSRYRDKAKPRGPRSVDQ